MSQTDDRVPAAQGRLGGPSETVCKLLILLSAIIWGCGFVVGKGNAERFPTFFILMVEFGIGALILLAVFRKRFVANLDRVTIIGGILVGLACWLGYYLVVLGLKYTTPGKNAFISGCYCVIVPFLGVFLGLCRPLRHNLVAAVLCVIGLGFIGADGGMPFNIGDLISLGAAVFFALQFVFVSKYGRDCDVWAITIWSFIVTAVLSCAATLVFEEHPSAADFDLPAIGAFLYSSVLGTCVAEGLVNYAFTKVDATSGSLIASLESPMSVLVSVLVGYDVFTMRLGIGFGFVFLAIIVSESWPGIRAMVEGVSDGS